MDEEKHYPPGAEPETPVEEPKPEAEAPEAEKPEAQTPDPEKEKADKPVEEEPPQLPKKRSIYDDLKDKKQEAKDAKARAEAAEAKAAELQALLDTKADATTPKEKADADDDIAAFAEAEGVTPESLDKLTKFIIAKLPKAPESMTPDELAAWRDQRAKDQQAAEDREVLDQSPSVKKQLDIQDEAEVKSVMDEIVRLAHTDAYHDKEVDYIVWKNRDALSKLVSPKKPSFETGGQNGENDEVAEVDFSTGKVTPEQVSRATTFPKSSYEVRKGK